MKTRYKKYSDYGMTKADVISTYEWLNACTDDDKQMVRVIVADLPPAVAEYVYLALTERMGYASLCCLGLDYGKSDFYGYKRKGLFLVYRWRITKW